MIALGPTEERALILTCPGLEKSVDLHQLASGGVTEHAPGLRFEQRLANPPEFPDADPECGLKALVFRQGF